MLQFVRFVDFMIMERSSFIRRWIDCFKATVTEKIKRLAESIFFPFVIRSWFGAGLLISSNRNKTNFKLWFQIGILQY
jgi:hypothetical protein